ncbi:NAD(P)-dependent oxidoreductase [Sinomicrobium pectinilyticum]|uniref:NAD(P)-dependent oxidoreductase n=1 Tax=Sinomicrobium pectinilyticum TaxID=1084421 RepID=A0A3N0DQS2_SINP1|nr:NAD(P)-dependent oxidoreductase [Sinomicrobium pectinilyticum]RNL77987.1 NAD(P)-dependent oxidoreductase [Sinomicrobium pectinilyticum]
MEKVVLIGASGFIGSALLSEALERGIHITAVVRNPENIKITHTNLKIVKADVSDAAVVTEVTKGVSTVISAFNPGWTNPAIYEETLRTYPAILKGVKEAGVKRILIVGGAGTLFVAPGVRVVDTDALPQEIMGGVQSLGEFYLNTLTTEKDIDWTFFSPAGIIEPGERTGNYRLGKDDLIINDQGESKISVQDYAKAMIDELENPAHHYERFTIGY